MGITFMHFANGFSMDHSSVEPQGKYINIPSEKYIYVRIYVYICVFT